MCPQYMPTQASQPKGGYRMLYEVISLAARHPLVRVDYHSIEVRTIREWPPR